MLYSLVTAQLIHYFALCSASSGHRLSHRVSHFPTKQALMIIRLLSHRGSSSSSGKLPPVTTHHPHHHHHTHCRGEVMATETRGHSWCFVSVGLATSPVSCGSAISPGRCCSVGLTFCPLFLFSGEEAHLRPVRGPEGWTQPHFVARGPLRSHPGMAFYLLHAHLHSLLITLSPHHTPGHLQLKASQS